ncbi:MAG TPA: spore germination protein GerW family protein [Ktedonobacterales bacterium]|jgi:uncharacterized spore protein YtfJ
MSAVTGARAVSGYGAQAANQTIEAIARAARPDVVFGQPIEREGVTIIPCAEIMMGMGMGGGGGTSPATGKAEPSEGQGIGAGGGMQGRPVAAIVIAQGTVRIEPIVDATKVALAALTTMGFMAFWVARLVATGRRPAAGGSAGRVRTPTIATLARALRRS